MDFYEHQDAARRSTTRLVVLFALAVVGIIAALYAVFVVASAYAGPGLAYLDLWQPGVLAAAAIGTAAVVGMGSATKMLALRAGGSAVAEGLGGKRVQPETTDSHERKLMNVVEEMSIASGLPVPEVYVLPERGINAFAAGFTPDDAAVGVTRGCIELLDRAELQGVIAHEFSHILNGDMRLNVRLIGILHGILLIGLLGRFLLHSMAFGAGRRRDKDDRSQLVFLAIGLALLVVGGIGFLCGRLIKAAVSRQREYLADASAVQFTRNPQGIAGALKKIAGYEEGSKVEARRAEEASHLFFSEAVHHFLGGSFATHPPLPERIRRLDPSFQGKIQQPASSAPADERTSGFAGAAPPPPSGALHDEVERLTADPNAVAGQVGRVSQAHLDEARRVLRNLPEPLVEAAHEPYEAEALVYALLLDPDRAERSAQWTVLEERAEPGMADAVRRLLPHVETLDPRGRLPLLDLTMPALRQLAPAQQRRFHDAVTRLSEADGRLSIFEFALRVVVQRRLAHAAHPDERPTQRRRWVETRVEALVVLAALAHAGHRDAGAAERAYREGASLLGATDPAPAVTLDALQHALQRLGRIPFQHRRRVLDAAAHVVLRDRSVAVQEAELLRAVAVALDCPLPPFLAQPQAAEA